jgi:hypothetical protein
MEGKEIWVESKILSSVENIKRYRLRGIKNELADIKISINGLKTPFIKSKKNVIMWIKWIIVSILKITENKIEKSLV